MPGVVFLMGPTASGKTALAVELVRRTAGALEIVSVDSAMVYRGLDIGTAKPDAATLAAAPHHLIDIRDPAAPYSAADFRADALTAIRQIHAAGRTPLLVGGTMLYFKALREGLSALPASNPEVRERLAGELARDGLPALATRLAAVDPDAARKHGDNPQRLLRALEVHALTGRTLTELQQATAPDAAAFPFRLLQLAVAPAREVLAERIATRFRAMLAAGFLDEVRRLRDRGDLHPDLPALRAVGYRQAWQHLAGQLSYDDMEARAIIATRQLAKRQMTWLRSWTALQWLDPDSSDPVADILKAADAASIRVGPVRQAWP
ncbi:MAG: tRNA (adenosine(37)-N6)-dimethylallyltransferase MiaA [Pseudomonadota bacterium]